MRERFERVARTRKQGGLSAQTAAATPYRFDHRVHKAGQSIIVPSVSSERREYLPVGFLDERTVVSNLAYVIYGAEPWLFTLLSSRLHGQWIRAVAGRMKNDIRYSGTLCYNTFPLPPSGLDDGMRAALTESAFGLLQARESHVSDSPASLYDPAKMPADLRHAHQHADEVVERVYRSRPFDTDDDRLEYLFDLYEASAGETVDA